MRSRFALPFAIAILLSLAACSGWVAQPLPRGPQPTRIAGKAVRVTRVGGEVLNLATAEVRGDTLYGMRVSPAGDPFVAVPLSEVTRLEAEQTSSSVPILLGIIAAVAVVWAALAPFIYSAT
ncbi:MAG: hypothetical protein ACJ8GN_30290 [Longimicrobiaceae bacterium]